MNPVADAPRKGAFGDMNDWLNALVAHRVSEARTSAAPMSAELAWIAENPGHSIYQRRSVSVVSVALAIIAGGMAATPGILPLVLSLVGLYFYVDFYSGILHVVLDNPRFVRLPLIGVPCAEFQWHHALPYDISTRRLVHVFGDINALVLGKIVALVLLAGVTRMTVMVTAVGFFWAYVNQYAHRSAHQAAAKRPPLTRWLQRHGVLVTPAVHHEHHTTHDRSFPVLSGRSRHLVQGLLRLVPNRWVWLGVFLMLTVVDLVAFARFMTWLAPRLPH